MTCPTVTLISSTKPSANVRTHCLTSSASLSRDQETFRRPDGKVIPPLARAGIAVHCRTPPSITAGINDILCRRLGVVNPVPPVREGAGNALVALYLIPISVRSPMPSSPPGPERSASTTSAASASRGRGPSSPPTRRTRPSGRRVGEKTSMGGGWKWSSRSDSSPRWSPRCARRTATRSRHSMSIR